MTISFFELFRLSHRLSQTFDEKKPEWWIWSIISTVPCNVFKPVFRRNRVSVFWNPLLTLVGIPFDVYTSIEKGAKKLQLKKFLHSCLLQAKIQIVKLIHVRKLVRSFYAWGIFMLYKRENVLLYVLNQCCLRSSKLYNWVFFIHSYKCSNNKCSNKAHPCSN